MTKLPIKKKKFEKVSISSIKQALGMTEEDTCASKPASFIGMPKAFRSATHLPGIPKGEVTIVRGWSNTGKSTLLNCLIASCQKQGILPIIYDSESNFKFDYAQACGVEAIPIYKEIDVDDVDLETGEITGSHKKKIVADIDGDFIYFDSVILAHLYGKMDYSTGKEGTVGRTTAVLEDIAYSINILLDMQEAGQIQQDMCFIWDSIGSIGSYKSLKSKTGNNMFDAGALQAAFQTIIGMRIPLSKRITSEYTNTMFCVNKIWLDNTSSIGIPSVQLKGGNGFFYATRLILHVGGALKASIKHLTATAKGQTYDWATQTKIKVVKNQLSAPYNIVYEGTFVCVPNGIIGVDEIDEYKKKNIPIIIKELEKRAKEDNQKAIEDNKNAIENVEINANDVSFGENEVEEE